MTELMQREVQELFYLFAAGLSVGFLFQIRDYVCRRSGRYLRVRHSLYLTFWVFASFLAYQFAYQGAYGVINWYSLLAFGVGMILWKNRLCDIIILYDSVQKQIGDLNDEKEDKRTYSKIRRKKRTK